MSFKEMVKCAAVVSVTGFLCVLACVVALDALTKFLL